MRRLAVAPAGEKSSLRVCHMPADKRRRVFRRARIARLVEHQPRAGKSRDHQSVPRGEHLVVAVERRARLAEVVQLLQNRLRRFGFPIRCINQTGDVFAVEISTFRNAAALAERLGVRAQYLRQLVRRENVVLALDAIAVGVLPAIESACRIGQLAQHVIQRPLRGVTLPRKLAIPPCFRIGEREQRVVVEHLLKMRRKPPPVGGVAREAAADVVEDTAAVHALERALCHFPRMRVLCRVGIA